MSLLNIKTMQLEDKYIIMEELWEDLSKNVNNEYLSPQWHIDILGNREKKLSNNESKFYDLDLLKQGLLDLTK